MENQGDMDQPPQSMEEAFARDAITSGVDAAAEDAAKRAEKEGREKVALDDKARENAADLTLEIEPELQRNKGEALASTIPEIADKETLSDNLIDTISAKWITAGINRYEAEQILGSSNLSPETKKKFLEQFPQMNQQEREDAERKDKMSEPEAAMKGRIVDAVRSRIASAGERANQTITEELDNLPEGQENKREELIARQGRVNSLVTKVKDLFAEEETGRKWARRVGKTLYISFLVLFILILLEMNLINKMSRTKR